MAVNTINELIDLLNQVDVDATVLAAIANDSPTSLTNGPSAGLVTTRLGSNVKNVQKVIADIENGIITGIRANIQEEGIEVVANASEINFVGTNLTVTDVSGVATITLAGEVSKVGTPVDNQVGVWTGDGTLEGDTTLTFDGAALSITADAAPTLNITDGNDAVTYTQQIINPGTPVAIIGTTTTHDLRVQTDNTPRFAIGSAGGVAVGTNTTTGAAFTINAAAADIRLQDTVSTNNVAEITNGSIDLVIAADVDNVVASSAIAFEIDGGEVVRIDDSGSVGIGETTPDALLHIRGGTAVGAAIDARSVAVFENNANTGITILGTALSEIDFGDAAEDIVGFIRYNHSVDEMLFGVGTAEALRIDAGNNIDMVNGDGYVISLHQVNPDVSAAYTLALTDRNAIVTMNNAGANTLTIDPVGTTAYPVGFVFEAIQLGAGATTIQAGAGVDLNGVTAGGTTLTAQYDVVCVRHVASDEWIISGDHGAVA